MPPKRNGSSPQDLIESKRKIKRVSNACQNCRKKKIKCNGETPCINCINYNAECYYSNKPATKSPDSDINFMKVRTLRQKAMLLAENLSNYEISENQHESFETITKQIDSLNNILEHRAKPKDTVDGYSRETEYYSQCRKARFWECMKDKHVVDPYFGLHSTLSIFGHSGREWISTKLTAIEKQYGVENPHLSKNCTDVFFKSWKIASRILNTDSKLWSEALSSNDWFQIIHTELDFNAVRLIIDGVNNDEVTCRHFTTKEALIQLVEKISNDVELTDCDYFPLICVLLRYKRQSIRLDKNKDVVLTIKSSRLIKFGVRLFQRLMFSSHGTFESLKGLIQFTEFMESPHISTSPTGLLNCAIDIAKNNGLHRMEYYVGDKEEECDDRRRLFWKLFVMDKINYLTQGKSLKITHTQVSTFLPSEIHDAMIKFNKQDWNFETLAHYISYFEIEVCKIVSKMYLNIFSISDYQYPENEILETLSQLQKIQISVITQIKPGNSIQIMNDNITQVEKNKLYSKSLHFHLLFFMASNYLLRNTLKELDNIHEPTVVDNDLKILDIFFQLASFEVYEVSHAKCTMPSACYLSYSYIKNPLDIQYSKKALDYILRYSEALYTQSLKNDDDDHWRITNVMFNTLVSPCVETYNLIQRQDQGSSDQNLIEEIKKFKERLQMVEETTKQTNQANEARLFEINQMLGVGFDEFLQMDGINNVSFYNIL